jgi:hypothetical protein
MEFLFQDLIYKANPLPKRSLWILCSISPKDLKSKTKGTIYQGHFRLFLCFIQFQRMKKMNSATLF